MYPRLSHALTACAAAATLLFLPASGVAQTQANATAVQAATSNGTVTGIAPDAMTPVAAAPKAHEAASNPYRLVALRGGSDIRVLYSGRAHSTALRDDRQALLILISHQARLRDVTSPTAWFLTTNEFPFALV